MNDLFFSFSHFQEIYLKGNHNLSLKPSFEIILFQVVFKKFGNFMCFQTVQKNRFIQIAFKTNSQHIRIYTVRVDCSISFNLDYLAS